MYFQKHNTNYQSGEKKCLNSYSEVLCFQEAEYCSVGHCPSNQTSWNQTSTECNSCLFLNCPFPVISYQSLSAYLENKNTSIEGFLFFFSVSWSSTANCNLELIFSSQWEGKKYGSWSEQSYWLRNIETEMEILHVLYCFPFPTYLAINAEC